MRNIVQSDSITGNAEVVAGRCSVKKQSLNISQNSRENTCAGVSFLIKLLEAGNFIKKKTPTKVLSCKFCEIFKNTYFAEHANGCFYNLLEKIQVRN